MLHILLVDDNPNDRLIAKRELKQLALEVDVHEVIDAESLERSLAEGGFDLVITDYRLCWSDGLTVLKAVKANYPDCPVIMFTDSGSEEIAVAGMKAGLSDYVLKHRQVYRLPLAVRESLEKQRLRQQYMETVEKLSISEERLRLALTSAQMGTWDWNLLTGQVMWSEHYEQLFGLSQDVFLDNYQSFITCVHPDDQAIVEDAIATAQQNKADYQQEFRILWPDGTVRWIAGRGKFFYDTAGQAIRMSGLVWDVTDRKQADVERQRLLESEQNARATAEYANRVKDEFLATLSHELRSPLNAILGWAKLVRSNPLNSDMLSRALEIIERNAQLQTQLIEDLLDISRILRGNLCLNVVPTNPAIPIAAAIDTMRLAADANSIQLITTLDQKVGLVSADAGRLQQVIWNLLSNAIKFTPAGGRVEVGLERVSGDRDGGDKGGRGDGGDGGDRASLSLLSSPPSSSSPPFPPSSYALITVADTGRGIHSDFLPYVFESFRQADSSTTRYYGGLGLGLAIVRYLVEMHGGKVWAESAGEGQGATFRVKLPLLNSNDVEVNAPSRDRPSQIAAAPLEGRRILVVDDDADNSEYLVFVLQQQGAMVEVAFSAREAIDRIERFVPDVLLSDIGMPGEDGYTLVRRVRQLETQQGRPIPAIALTAYARTEDRDRAIAAGFQQHLAKPIEPDVLIAAILHLIPD
jgi:PAS domain S-box-containing protein